MLSVIVPAYQEQDSIYQSIDLLRRSLDAFGRHYEVIVVSDGNVDRTADEAARHEAPVRVIGYDRRRGKGYALRYGIGQSTGDLVAIIDADMELHPDGICGLVELVEAGADAAIGSKRHPDSRIAYPPFRRVQSAVYQWMIRRLFALDVTDTQTGLKVFRGPLVREAAPSVASDGFAFDLELLVEIHDRGGRVVEGPIQLDYAFETTTGVRAVIDILRDTAAIRLRRGRGRRSRVLTGRRSDTTEPNGDESAPIDPPCSRVERRYPQR